MVEVYVSKLRQLLGPPVVVTRSPGYLLHTGPESVDVHWFEALVAEGEEASTAGEPQSAASRFASALALWRGSPLADFTFEPFAQGEIVRLEELRLLAEEGRIDAEISLGRSAELVGELEQLVALAPFRERYHAQLMLILYRAGRQADALAAYRRARQTLVEELGVEPGEELRSLEHAILAQEAWLGGATRVRTRGARRESRRVVTLVLAELAVSGPDADPEALQPLMKRRPRATVTRGSIVDRPRDRSSGRHAEARPRTELTGSCLRATIVLVGASATFSFDGRRILTSSLDATVPVFACDIRRSFEDLVARSEARLAGVARALMPAEWCRYLESGR
jgi:DNA-binding SARP family transcriptional activator